MILAKTFSEGLPHIAPKKDHITRPSDLSDEHFHVLHWNSLETNNIMQVIVFFIKINTNESATLHFGYQQQSLNTHISGQYKHNMLQQIAVSIMLY